MPETIGDIYQSKYLGANDLKQSETKFIIESIEVKAVGQQTKLVIQFVGLEKEWPVNKINAKNIAKLTGTERFSEWKDWELTLVKVPVSLQDGSVRDGIRVKDATKK